MDIINLNFVLKCYDKNQIQDGVICFDHQFGGLIHYTSVNRIYLLRDISCFMQVNAK